MKKQKDESEKIAAQMASYFQQRFTTEQLVCWVIKANYLIFRYNENFEPADRGQAGSFLSNFEYYLIPGLLRANSNQERKIAIKDGLIAIFESVLYDNAKVSLTQIGNAFLIDYSKSTCHSFVLDDFMKQTGSFMALSEMYGDYKSSKNQNNTGI